MQVYLHLTLQDRTLLAFTHPHHGDYTAAQYEPLCATTSAACVILGTTRRIAQFGVGGAAIRQGEMRGIVVERSRFVAHIGDSDGASNSGGDSEGSSGKGACHD